jgi:hypothetical protein
VPVPPVAAGEHTAWLLEVAAAARADEERPVLRKGCLAPWSSRRARTRARRALIRERLGAASSETFEPPENESIDDRLLERISVYTHGQQAQPAATTSLRSTATGPGLA